MNKAIKVIFPVLAAASILASCTPETAGGGSGTINLLIWEDASNIETIEKIAEYFKADYKRAYPLAPDIEFTFEARNEAAAVSDLLTIGESGEGPDIAAITSDTLATAVRSNLVAPVSYDEEVKNCFEPEVVSNVTIDGDVYAYPITAESQTIMYNKEEVTDPSIFDSFESLLASGESIAWDVNDEDCAYYCFGFLTDADLFGEDGTDASSLNLDTDKGSKNLLDAFTTYRSAITPAAPETAAALLAAGEVAGIVTSPFLYQTLANSIGAENVGLHKLPTINGEEMRPFSGYKEYVVSSYSSQPAIAQMFANYIVNPDSQIERMLDLNYLPTRYDGDVNEFLTDNEILETYKASYDLSKPMPTIEQMGYYWSPMINFCKAMWNAGTSLTIEQVKTGLQEVEDTIKGNN